MAGSPILPKSDADPTGVAPIALKAIKDYTRRMRRVLKVYLEALESIPAQPVVNARYTFDLDQSLISSIFTNIGFLVDEILNDGGSANPWLFNSYVGVAYDRGVAQELTNLTRQSPAYGARRGTLAQVLQTPPYQRRVALVRARVFEEMKGLTETTKTQMSRVLTEGIASGRNPLEIADNLTQQAGIEAKRAARIARTETLTALRRARWDETEEASERYDAPTKQLHMSALKPTTRLTHAARHGRLFTTDEVRDWYADGANAINCYCSQIAVLVDEDGEPLNSTILARARKRYEIMKERDEGPWARVDDNQTGE